MNRHFLMFVLVAAFGLLTIASTYSATGEGTTDTADDFAAAGCAAFPVAVHESNRSVTPPGEGTKYWL